MPKASYEKEPIIKHQRIKGQYSNRSPMGIASPGIED